MRFFEIGFTFEARLLKERKSMPIFYQDNRSKLTLISDKKKTNSDHLLGIWSTTPTFPTFHWQYSKSQIHCTVVNDWKSLSHELLPLSLLLYLLAHTFMQNYSIVEKSKCKKNCYWSTFLSGQISIRHRRVELTKVDNKVCRQRKGEFNKKPIKSFGKEIWSLILPW